MTELLNAFHLSSFTRCSAVAWLPRVPSSPPPPRVQRGRAAAAAAEGPDEDGVHRRSDEAARGAVRAHRLPGGGGAGRGVEEQRAERGDGPGECRPEAGTGAPVETARLTEDSFYLAI